MKKKKIIFEVIFIILVTGLTIYYLYASGVFQHASELKELSFGNYLLVLLPVFGYILCDCFIIYRSMKGIRKEARFFDGIGTYCYGNLGSGVTPWKSAHFPMIGFFLRRRKYNLEETLSIMASNQLIYSVTLPVLYGVFMIYGIVNHSTVEIGNVNLPLFLISIIGIVTNTSYFLFLFLSLYNSRFQRFILELEIKIRRIKDEEKKEEFRSEKLLKMRVYRETAERMRKNILSLIPSIIAYLLFMFCCFGAPYFIYLVLSKNTFSISDYMYCFMLCQAMSYVTNIVPVPGGMIAAEFSFITVYQVFMGSFVNAAVLLYRFSTYILILLIDFVFFIAFELYSQFQKKKIASE